MTLLLYLIHVNVKRIPEGTGLLVRLAATTILSSEYF